MQPDFAYKITVGQPGKPVREELLDLRADNGEALDHIVGSLLVRSVGMEAITVEIVTALTEDDKAAYFKEVVGGREDLTGY